MNKRQAKKMKTKNEMFLNSFTFSYREERKLARQYHEYIVAYKKHTEKHCKGCPHFIDDRGCDKVLVLEQCIRKGERR